MVDIFRMTTIDKSDMPLWLREGLDQETTDDDLNKRSESRHSWLILTRAKLLANPSTELSAIKTYNISCNGLGLITREELHEGDELEISPMDDNGESVHVRVVYCKQTIQGYRVGCEFVTD